MENKLYTQDNSFFKDLTFPRTTIHVCHSWNLPETESRQQHSLVLGEHLKTTATEPLQVLHLGFCVGHSGCYENSLSSQKTFNAFCWLSERWISKWENSWKKPWPWFAYAPVISLHQILCVFYIGAWGLLCVCDMLWDPLMGGVT